MNCSCFSDLPHELSSQSHLPGTRLKTAFSSVVSVSTTGQQLPG